MTATLEPMVNKPARATEADLENLPENMKGEIIDGQLYMMPRGANPHTLACTILSVEIGGPFGRGKNGPGGWLILNEPEIHIGNQTDPDILVPDLAGWRRERIPDLSTTYIHSAPDWVCEVLSPSTRAHDRVRKMPVYAREGVRHVWLVEPLERVLEVYEADGPSWRRTDAFEGKVQVRAKPFGAVEIDLTPLWEP